MKDLEIKTDLLNRCMSCQHELAQNDTLIEIEENPKNFMFGLFSEMKIFICICINCYAKWLLKQ